MISFPRSEMHQFMVNALLTSAAILALSAGAQSAFAAPQRPVAVHKIKFNGTAHDTVRLLDWRRPSDALTFDVPANDWVDDIELLLSARPSSPVNAQSPLLVRFNDGAPIPLKTDGHGFDARITLDKGAIRNGRNKVSFEYQVPAGEACLAPDHGAWDIDAVSSFVVVKARAKTRAPNFRDLKTSLGSDTTAPKTVTLLSKGETAPKLQALTAQGLMQNITDVPNFRLSRTRSDLEIIAGRRGDIKEWISDPSILDAKGPVISVRGGAHTASGRLQLIIAGDTDADVMSAVKAFSGFPLPANQGSDVHPARFMGVMASGTHPPSITGKTSLADIGVVPFASNWAPRPQNLSFDVSDPSATFGRVSLDLRAGSTLDPNSALNVSLNGQSLGTAKLNRAKQTASFDIPRGLLKGLGNNLTLTPTLTPATSEQSCAALRKGTGFALGPKSNINLRIDDASDATDLSLFSASGLPFSDHSGMGTHVVLAVSSDAERQAALRLLAQMAKATGAGWADARFSELSETSWPSTGNVLLIGSHLDPDIPVLAQAPKGLKLALGGTASQTVRATRSAMLDQPAISLLSAREVVVGGVAALYRDSQSPDRVFGVITQTRGQSFIRAVDNLLAGEHWNDLEGSVARWNDKKVTMAQTAHTVTTKAAQSTFSMASMGLPDIQFKTPNMPDIDISAAKGLVLRKWASISVWTKTEISKISLLQRFQSQVPEREPALDANVLQTLSPDPSLELAGPALSPNISAAQISPLPKMDSRRAQNIMPVLQNPLERGTPGTLEESAAIKAVHRPVISRQNFPKAPTHKILGHVGTGVSAVYAQATERVAGVLSETRLGRYKRSNEHGTKLIILALIGMVVLVGMGLAAPHKTTEKK